MMYRLHMRRTRGRSQRFSRTTQISNNQHSRLVVRQTSGQFNSSIPSSVPSRGIYRMPLSSSCSWIYPGSLPLICNAYVPFTLFSSLQRRATQDSSGDIRATTPPKFGEVHSMIRFGRFLRFRYSSQLSQPAVRNLLFDFIKPHKRQARRSCRST